MKLVVSRLVYAKGRFGLQRNFVDRHEVNGRSLGTVDAEEVDLSLVAAATLAWPLMMPIAAADVEADGTIAEAAGLALNPGQRQPVIDDEVVSRVLAEREEYGHVELLEDCHDCERGFVADVLWVTHAKQGARGIGWAVSKTDNATFAYDVAAPE